MNAACFSNSACAVLIVAFSTSVLGLSPASAGEDAQDKITNLEAFVDEVDRVLEQDQQRITRFPEKLDYLIKQADGDVAKVIGQILQGDDKVIARAYASWMVLEGAKFGHGVIPSKAVPSDVAAELVVRLMLRSQRKMGGSKATATLVLRYEYFQLASAHELLEAIVPHLKTDDPNLRNELYEVLAYKLFERAPFSRRFSPIATLLEAQGGQVDAHLVQFMFVCDPDEAVLTLADFYVENDEVRKSLLLAYRTLDTAVWKDEHNLERPPNVEAKQREALTILAEHKQWWARLYTAQIMKEEPVFRLPELFNKLKNDEHPLVRETLGRVALE